MYSNHHYNPKLQPYAKKLRYRFTKGELLLWSLGLSKRKMLGLSFRRQRPIGNFIVDFYCKEIHLAIEVDGASHRDENTLAKDMKKSAYLQSIGVKLLRLGEENLVTSFYNTRELLEDEILEYMNGEKGAV
ncbi:MAG: DUF559 domain-containing protein [Saprospiraceae bacterium]|nr:DUF559 domain-containing protein [Saprospiraceae bacterium]